MPRHADDLRPAPRVTSRRRRTAATAGLAAAALLAATAGLAADAERGARLYEARCGGCHVVEHDRIGPRHAGLLGRRAGSVAGFDYSPALRAAGFVWDAQRLDRWLADPEALVPGQRMNFRVAEAADRADLIAYLARAAHR
jgi:cytochrome c